MNKVRYNLKNVHYAKLTISATDVPTYAAPVKIPGAVSISLSAQGDTTPFYADGGVYYVSTSNNGYSGDLSVALIPDSFRKDILCETEDSVAKVMIENSAAVPAKFALLFEFDGDEKAIRHVLYHCDSTRPNMEGSTTTGGRDPATETLTITAVKLPDGKIKAKTGTETTKAVYDGWYTSVWLPTTV